MADRPTAMLRNGRPRDQEFRPEERLFRRVPLQLWDDGNDPIEVDAIELPDLSVLREKYGHPEWARLESEECGEWGVICFEVQDIPPRLQHLGVFIWSFRPRHVPLEENYPHSEVWAYENETHINAKHRIDPDLHLRWREMLLRRIRVALRPYQQARLRIAPPDVR